MRRLVLLLLVGCHEAPPQKTAHDVSPETAPPPVVVVADGGVVASPAPVAVAPAAPALAKPKSAKVRIVIKSVPPKSLVTWGKKKLGPTPVTLDRPRDSGPMDLIVKNPGYFSVHTRAYTFRNEVLYVKLTKVTDKMTLFGAKQDLEPSPSPSPMPQ